MRKLSTFLFGGYFDTYHVSTHDTWVQWRMVKDHWWARKINAVLNHE